MIVTNLKEANDDKYKIFDAHLEILNDVALLEVVEANILNEKMALDYAVSEAFQMFIELLETVEDDLIKERIADLKDVKNRIIKNC